MKNLKSAMSTAAKSRSNQFGAKPVQIIFGNQVENKQFVSKRTKSL
jgi:hypothetical protein